MGPDYVVLKKGEHGAYLLAEDWRFAVPAYPVSRVVDPTGAGDSFAGGLMGHIAREGNIEPSTLRQAMRYGTAAASCCVEGFSTEQVETGSIDQIEKRREELIQLITP